MRRQPSPLIGIFLTVLIDLLSFGLVIPDIQLRGEALGAEGWVRGLVLATFSIAQIIASPYLGRMSDRVGRRPILLVTTALAIGSYLFYASAEVLWIMFVARALSGMAGSNLGVAYAYISDITKPLDRARSFGMLGAAFGIGFILGPVFGALLIKAGNGHPHILGYTAAVISLVNLVYIALWLPESLHLGAQHPSHAEGTRPGTFRSISIALTTPGLGVLLGLFFAYNFGFANLETTYFLLVTHDFHLSQEQGAYMLAYVGVISAIMQGGVVRLVMPRFGEVRLMRFAYLLVVPSIVLVPWLHPWLPHLGILLTLGIGAGLAQPSLSSLISRRAPPAMVGGVFGVTQALGAVSRILAPLISNELFDRRSWLPYAVAGCMIIVPLVGAFRLGSDQGESGEHAPEPHAT